MSKLEYAIWMSILNIIPIKKYRLFQKMGSFQAIYEAKKEEYLAIEGIDLLDLHELDSMKEKEEIQKYAHYIHENQIQVITIEEERYPAKLKSIYDPPLVLLAKGNLDLLSKNAIAIVGSRMSDQYGNKEAYEMAKELASYDICVISGFAKGIDSMAHLGAIRRCGNTIAILRMWA